MESYEFYSHLLTKQIEVGATSDVACVVKVSSFLARARPIPDVGPLKQPVAKLYQVHATSRELLLMPNFSRGARKIYFYFLVRSTSCKSSILERGLLLLGYLVLQFRVPEAVEIRILSVEVGWTF